MKHLFSVICSALLFTLPLAAQETLSDRVSSQAECIRTVQHNIDAINQVMEMAFPAQKAVLIHTRQHIENLITQGKCQEAQQPLNAVLPLLHTLQQAYLQNQLEDLEHLFLGPTTLEQRAMLREGIALIKGLREKGLVEEAIFVTGYLDESFDTPPALSPKQRRNALYQDALETIDMWYEWGQETLKSAEEQALQQWQQKFIRQVTDTWTDVSLSEEETAARYDTILDQAEKEFTGLTSSN